jgi:hypothetical protein
MSLSVFQLKVEVLEKQYRPFSQEYLPCKPQAFYIFSLQLAFLSSSRQFFIIFEYFLILCHFSFYYLIH